MSHRLFIALQLPSASKVFLSESTSELRTRAGKSWKWESESKYHLTLKFLGECKEDQEQTIINSVKSFEKIGSFNFRFDKFGFFKDKNILRIFWAGLKFEKNIQELAARIDDEMSALNFPKEKRRFHPHITLLRIKDDYDISFIRDYEGKEFPENFFEATSVCLFSSILNPGGSVYNKVFEINLLN